MAARIAEFTVARSRRFACMRGRRMSMKRFLSRIGSSASVRSSTANGGGSAVASTSTVHSPSSTAPVAILSLTVPSGRRRTVPVTATTYSLLMSTLPSMTHWTIPE